MITDISRSQVLQLAQLVLKNTSTVMPGSIGMAINLLLQCQGDVLADHVSIEQDIVFRWLHSCFMFHVYAVLILLATCSE